MGFLRGLSIAIGANAILFVLSFLNNKLLYIYLSPDQNGTFFLVLRYALLISMLFGEWVRLTNMNIAGGAKELTRTLSTNMLVYSLAVAAGLGAGAVFLPGKMHLLFPGTPAVFLGAIIAVGVLLMLRDSSQSLLMVNNRMRAYGITYIIWGGIFLFLDILFIIIMGKEITAVVLALIIATASAALWAFGFNAASSGLARKPSFSLFGRSFRLGIRSAVAVAGMFFMLNVHTFLLEPLSPDAGQGLVMVALFSVCWRVSQLFQRGADVTGTMLYATVAQQKQDSGYRATLLVCRNVFMGMIVLSAVGILSAKYLIYLVADASYLDAWLPLVIMFPGVVFLTTGSVVNSSYWARNFPFRVILAPFAAAAFGALCDVLFIPTHGVAGASMAFTLMSAGWFIYIISVFKFDSKYRFSEILIPRISDFVLVYSKVRGWRSRDSIG